MENICSFVKVYKDKFDLSDLKQDDIQTLVISILQSLRLEDKPTNTKNILSTLNAVRILSRAKLYIDGWMSEEMLSLLIVHSSLNHYKQRGDAVLLPDNINTEVVNEAIKCLCNLTFNSPKVQSMCEKEQCMLMLLQRAKTYSDKSIQHSLKYFDMRFMFIITALVKKTRTQATLEWDGLSVLSHVIHDILASSVQSKLTDENCDLAIELLKTLYNLTLIVSPWREEYHFLDQDLAQLVTGVRRLICQGCETKEKHLDIIKHCSNLFTTLPSSLAELLVPQLDTPEGASGIQRSFQGHDVSAIAEIFRLLKIVLEESTLHSQKERLLPVLLTLTFLSRSNRIIRKYSRLRILPHLRDEVKRLPEEGDSLRNRLCKLLTTPHTEVKQVVADLLYVLCKENVSRLIKYSGFGNAAGLLAQYGLLSGRRSSVGMYSDDSDSDTEEYKDLEPNVNPVTGRYEEVRPHPMQGMTDEQKEYEATLLINAMDKLQRLGVVQPSTIGEDGKPVPVEHVLQLARDPDNDDDAEDD